MLAVQSPQLSDRACDAQEKLLSLWCRQQCHELGKTENGVSLAGGSKNPPRLGMIMVEHDLMRSTPPNFQVYNRVGYLRSRLKFNLFQVVCQAARVSWNLRGVSHHPWKDRHGSGVEKSVGNDGRPD